MTFEELIEKCPMCKHGAFPFREWVGKILKEIAWNLECGSGLAQMQLDDAYGWMPIFRKFRGVVSPRLEKIARLEYRREHSHADIQKYSQDQEDFLKFFSANQKKIHEFVGPLQKEIEDLRASDSRRHDEMKASTFSKKAPGNPAEKTEVLKFSEEKSNRQKELKMSKDKKETMKVYSTELGQRVDVPVQDKDIADLAAKIQRENPGMSVYDAMIEASKQLQAVKQSEKQDGKGTAGLDAGAYDPKMNEDVPEAIVEEFSKIPQPAGRLAYITVDGQKWSRDFKGQICMVDGSPEDEEYIVKFLADPDYASGKKRFERRSTAGSAQGVPEGQKKRAAAPAHGFSEDQTSFTDREGREIPVDDGTDEENEFSDVLIFQNRFAVEIRQLGIPASMREEIVRKAVKLLTVGGLDIEDATPENARLALQAGMGSPEKFQKSMNYVLTGDKGFQSFQQAVAVALA